MPNETRTRSTSQRPLVAVPQPAMPATLHICVFAVRMTQVQADHFRGFVAGMNRLLNAGARLCTLTVIDNGLVIQVAESRDYPYGREHPTEVLGDIIMRLRQSVVLTTVVEGGFRVNRAL